MSLVPISNILRFNGFLESISSILKYKQISHNKINIINNIIKYY